MRRRSSPGTAGLDENDPFSRLLRKRCSGSWAAPLRAHACRDQGGHPAASLDQPAGFSTRATTGRGTPTSSSWARGPRDHDATTGIALVPAGRRETPADVPDVTTWSFPTDRAEGGHPTRRGRRPRVPASRPRTPDYDALRVLARSSRGERSTSSRTSWVRCAPRAPRPGPRSSGPVAAASSPSTPRVFPIAARRRPFATSTTSVATSAASRWLDERASPRRSGRSPRVSSRESPITRRVACRRDWARRMVVRRRSARVRWDVATRPRDRGGRALVFRRYVLEASPPSLRQAREGPLVRDPLRMDVPAVGGR